MWRDRRGGPRATTVIRLLHQQSERGESGARLHEGAALAGDGNYAAPGDFDAGPSDGPVSLMPGAGAGEDDPIGDQIAQSASEPAPDDVSLPLDPNAAFDYASSFLLAGDYSRAKAAFSLYVEAFPNHPRTADAQFRLGEIHLALGENTAAADAFIAHIRNYPNDQRSA